MYTCIRLHLIGSGVPQKISKETCLSSLLIFEKQQITFTAEECLNFNAKEILM